MTKRLITILTLTLALGVTALSQAQSIDGKWTAQVMGRGGAAAERIYTFKQTGATFTGSYPGNAGAEVAITDGKIDGGKITFKISQAGRGGGAPVEQNWTGTLTADKLTMNFAPPAPPADAAAPAAGAGGGGGRGRGGPQTIEATRVK